MGYRGSTDTTEELEKHLKGKVINEQMLSVRYYTHGNNTTINVFRKMSVDQWARRRKVSPYGIAAALFGVSHLIRKTVKI